jgi:hypothetical protein
MPDNKGMNLANVAMVSEAAPFAGYAQRSTDVAAMMAPGMTKLLLKRTMKSVVADPHRAIAQPFYQLHGFLFSRTTVRGWSSSTGCKGPGPAQPGACLVAAISGVAE